jgi:hypothetical protein
LITIHFLLLKNIKLKQNPKGLSSKKPWRNAPEARNVNNRRWSVYSRGTGGRRSLSIASHRDETNTVRETSQRIEGIAAYYDTSQTLIYGLLAMSTDSCRWDALQSGIHLFSDAELAVFQEQARDAVENYLQRLNAAFVGLALLHEDATRQVFSQYHTDPCYVGYHPLSSRG